MVILFAADPRCVSIITVLPASTRGFRTSADLDGMREHHLSPSVLPPFSKHDLLTPTQNRYEWTGLRLTFYSSSFGVFAEKKLAKGQHRSLGETGPSLIT